MSFSRGRLRAAAVLGALGILAVGAALVLQPAHAASGGVSIVDFTFSPASITVNTGDTVTWMNTGSATHTATSDAGAFDSGLLKPGAGFSFTFSQPGTFTYHCNVHPNMHGTVVVQAAAVVAAPAKPAAVAPAAVAQASKPVAPSAAAPASKPAAPSAQQAAPARASIPANMTLPATGSGGGDSNSTAVLLLALCGAVLLSGCGVLTWKVACSRTH